MSGKIPSKTQFTIPADAAISAMDVLGYMNTDGEAVVSPGYGDVDFVILNTAAEAGDAVSCDPQPAIANLTAVLAVTAGGKLLAATGGGIRLFPGVAAREFTAADTDIVTLAGHGLLTGDKVRVTTSAADLPAGLAVDTDYYVIKIDADTFKLASSLSNALAGTAVDITDAGTGTHSLRLYGEITVIGKALEAGAVGQKVGTLFQPKTHFLP